MPSLNAKACESISRRGGDSSFTLRERFRRTMHYQTVDRIPNFEFGYWDETLPAWHLQGLPSEINTEAKAYKFFGIEDYPWAPVECGIWPAFEYQILEEDKSRRVIIDQEGIKCQVYSDGTTTIPHFLEYPIKGPADWCEFKRRLQPDTPGRYPDNWPVLTESWRERDVPLAISIGSIIGWPRNWMGVERVCTAFYDEPAMMAEIVGHLGDLICAAIEPALQQVEFDLAFAWEDICYRNGPIISPGMFRRYVLPQYKKITRLLSKNGVDVVVVDCDGDIDRLIPIFLEGGVNCMFPVQVIGKTDPVTLRALYGRDLLLWGGIDKQVIQGTHTEIDRELARLAPVAAQGGFIPHFDHQCPPTVPYENYLYYLEGKKTILAADHDKVKYGMGYLMHRGQVERSCNESCW